MGLLVLLMPAGVLYVFYVVLLQVVRLPETLGEMQGQGEAHATTIYTTVTTKGPRRIWRFFRSGWELVSLLMESKELLIGTVGLVRLVNPITFFILAGAVLVTLALIALAVVL